MARRSSRIAPAAPHDAHAVDLQADVARAETAFREVEEQFHVIEAETRAIRALEVTESSEKEIRLRSTAIIDAVKKARSLGAGEDAKPLLGSIAAHAEQLLAAIRKSSSSADERLERIETGIARLRAVAATLPDVAAAVGLSLTDELPDTPELAKVVEAPKEIARRKVAIKHRGTLGSRRDLDSDRRSDLEVVSSTDDKDELREFDPVGKVRFRLLSGDSGTGLPAAVFQVVGQLAGGGDAVLAAGQTTKAGYGSVNLSDIPESSLTGLQIRLASTDARGVPLDLDRKSLALARETGTPHVLTVPKDRVAILVPGDPRNPGTIEDPDERDAAHAPEAFQFDTQMHDGNCCIRPQPEIATRQYFFRQIVRVHAPRLVSQKGKLVDREALRAPVHYGDESPGSYAVLAGNAVLGRAVTYRQSWRPIKQGLGSLLYSLALAPREQVKLAVIDWSRRETATRQQTQEVREQLTYDQHRDRAVDETVASVLHEEQHGSSSSWSAGGGFDFFGLFGGGGGGGGSSSDSEGYRNLVTNTRQRIADNVSQRASSLRTQRASVITTSVQTEHEQIQTRIVQNHNINHALTIQYYQVLAHYRVVTDVHEEQDILLVPYGIPSDLFDTIPSFEKFRLFPSRPITRFLLRHRQLFERLVPTELQGAFDSLSRLVLCGDVYRIRPRATISQWTIDLEQSHRVGLQLFIETSDGQTVPLTPRGPAGTHQFTSDPVDVSEIRSLRVTLDTEAAARATIQSTSFNILGLFGGNGQLPTDLVKATIEHRLTRVTIQARTDRSQYVPTPRNFAIGVAGADATLNAANPSTTVGLSVSAQTLESMFEEWLGREHADYCRLQELIAFIQSNPLYFAKAIWMTENPDRRALRLDRFTFNGSPLLDQVENRPIGTVGNLVAFPLLARGRLLPTTHPMREVSSRFVSLPTRGVFAEVYLSCCNATEIRDPARVIDLEALRQLSAPEITGIQPASRRERPDTTLATLPGSLVSIQNPGALPDPATAAALAILGKSDLFRDMSNAAATSALVKDTLAKVFDDLKAYRETQASVARATLDTAGKVLPSLLGAAGAAASGGAGSGGAGAAGGAAGAAAGSAGGSAGAAETAGALAPALLALASTAPDPATAAAAGHLARSSDTRNVYDLQSMARRAIDDGLISKEQGAQVLTALLGGTAGAGIVPASFVTGPSLPDEPKLRTCCLVGINDPTELPALGPHVYGGGGAERNGFIRTTDAGLIDTGHLRHTADMTGYLAAHAADKLGRGGRVRSSGTDFWVNDGLWELTFLPQNMSPDPELCILLGQRIAYELALWHEVRTYWDAQRPSSFSPEDNYSNILGTYVGADSLRSNDAFDVGVRKAIDARLTALGARPLADTSAFLGALRSQPDPWYDSSILTGFAARRRHVQATGTIVPWKGKGTLAAAAAGLAVPDKSPTGDTLTNYYRLRIGAGASSIPDAEFPGGTRGDIQSSDLASFVARIAADVGAAGARP